MDIGRMRSRITIQKAVPVSDDIGNRTNEWRDYRSCFAFVNLASGKEYTAAAQTLNGDTLVFVLRWCEDLKDLDPTRFRIVFGGRLFNITCVDDVLFRHESIKITGELVRR